MPPISRLFSESRLFLDRFGIEERRFSLHNYRAMRSTRSISNNEQISRLVFGFLAVVMIVSSFWIWVALHRNIFGPGGQLGDIYLDWWNTLVGHISGRANIPYWPSGNGSHGFVLRNSLFAYSAAYVGLLGLLRSSSWSRRVSLGTLVGLAVVVALPLILMPYLWSSDLFDYSAYGRLMALHSSNPYFSSIAEFPSDPFMELTCWRTASSVYGPVWTLFSMLIVGIAQATGGSVAAYVVLFRSSMFLFVLASATLLWKILGRAGAPDRAFQTAIFLFNPLVLIEFAGNGHNESLMIALILAGLFSEQRGRWALAALCFTVAAETKLYCLPVFCLFLAYRCWRAASPQDALRRALALLLIFAGVSVVLYAPFGFGTISSPLHGPGSDSMTKSLGEFVVYHTSIHLADLPVVGILFAGNLQSDVQRFALMSTGLVCLACAFYARTLSRAVTAMAFSSFFWCTIGATWFMPWYVTVVVALIPICRSRPLALAGWTLSFTVFLIYLLEGWSLTDNAWIRNFSTTYFEPLVFLPPLGVLALAFCLQRYARRERIDTLPAALQHERSRA